MKRNHILLPLFLLIYCRIYGGEAISFSCELTSRSSLMTDCTVRNTGEYTVEILKSALAEDGSQTSFPDARYIFLAFFPAAKDGQRVEECVGKWFSGYKVNDYDTFVTLKPGESIKFRREIVARNDSLISRLKTEHFVLLWHVMLRFKVVHEGPGQTRVESVQVGKFNGFCDSDTLKGGQSQP